MKISVFVFLTLVFICAASCETERTPGRFEEEMKTATRNAFQNRDLTQYEFGGIFMCHTRASGGVKDRRDGEKKVRDFIWQRWTEKKRGFVVLNCPFTDTSNTTHYFIEPKENGEWHIVRSNIHRAFDDKLTPSEHNISSVERVENSNSKDWTLILKATDGEIVERLPL